MRLISVQEYFAENYLPHITRCAQSTFKAFDADSRDERVQDVVSYAWYLFIKRRQRGDDIPAASLTRYAIAGVAEGRGICGSHAQDIMTRRVRREYDQDRPKRRSPDILVHVAAR